MDDDIKNCIQEFFSIMDEFSDIEFLPGTNSYNLQQLLVHRANVLRDSLKEDSSCEHSGVKFNKDGKLVDFL